MSTLKVGTIQDNQNSNNALVINSAGVVTQPAKPMFRVDQSADQPIADSTPTVAVSYTHLRAHETDS